MPAIVNLILITGALYEDYAFGSVLIFGIYQSINNIFVRFIPTYLLKFSAAPGSGSL